MYDQGQTAQEMPRYRCHKEVWALKIGKIESVERALPEGRKWFIVPDDRAYAPFQVDFAWLNKHQPEAGGYYVVYKDGYQSFSPAQAFEEGYTRV